MEKIKHKKAEIVNTVAILGLVIALLISVVGYKFNSEQRNTLSVSGTSELTVVPDEAQVFFNVITDEKNAKDAQIKNKELTTSVMDALKNHGISASNIETTNYNLYKKTKWNQTTMAYDEAGYTLTNTIKVTTSNISNVGSLVDVAINAGANGVDYVTFTLTKEKEQLIKAQALEKATLAAREKANNLAENLDVKIVEIVSVQESNFYYTPYEYMPNYATKMDSSALGNTIAPQNVDVTSTISIVFEIN